MPLTFGGRIRTIADIEARLAAELARERRGPHTRLLAVLGGRCLAIKDDGACFFHD